MSPVREMHAKAMMLAHDALLARESGRPEESVRLAREALSLERAAAEMIGINDSNEPTRSLLYTSAASLASQAGDLNESLRLAAMGLAGRPSSRAQRELLAILDQAKFEIRLREDRQLLASGELNLSMDGDVVGFGIVPYADFQRRLDWMFKLITKTVQRLAHRTYQSAGQVAKEYQYFTPALAAPQGGSFNIVFRFLEMPEAQTPMFMKADKVISEILETMALVQSADSQQLREKISDPKYYTHFISSVREMAPDGSRIRLVGLSSDKEVVILTRTRGEIKLERDDIRENEGQPKAVAVEVIGLLDLAVSRKQDLVGLTTDDGKHFDIEVPDGIDDLVRTHFKQRVVVKGLLVKPNLIVPDDIFRIEE